MNCTGNLASPSTRRPESDRAVGRRSLGGPADPSDRSGEARNVPAVGDGRGFLRKPRERALPRLANLASTRRLYMRRVPPRSYAAIITKVARQRSNIYRKLCDTVRIFTIVARLSAVQQTGQPLVTTHL